MAGLYQHTNRQSGQTLTAAMYNGDHQAHVDGLVPELMDDHSADVIEMQVTTAPGNVGSEVLASSFAGELERVRFQIQAITGRAQWYEDPPPNPMNSGVDIDGSDRLFGYGAKIAVRDADFTLAASDAGVRIECDKATALTVTVPDNSSVALPVGFRVALVQVGAGRVELSAGSGVDIRSRVPLVLTRQWSLGDLVKRATDEWIWIG